MSETIMDSITDSGVDSTSVSRPKVHRLPVQASLQSEFRPELKDRMIINRSILVFCGLTTLIGSFVLYQYRNAITNTPTASMQITQKMSLTQTAALERVSEKGGAGIYLKEGDDIIVGRLAKIPPEREKTTEIKTLADIDKPSGRDLLSIISKY